MPHVIVKLWPGKSEEQKTRLAERITKDVMDVLNYGEESVSVSLEEVSPQDWVEKGLKPDRPHWPERSPGRWGRRGLDRLRVLTARAAVALPTRPALTSP